MSLNQAEGLKEYKMEPLKLVKEQVNAILDFQFFLDEKQLSESVEDVVLAKAIHGKNFERALQRAVEFKQKAERTLEELGNRVAQYEAELNGFLDELKKTKNKAEMEKPGLITRAMGAEEYNKQVDKYNNLVELCRRIADKAERARDRYDESLQAFNDRKAELVEQIREKMETLKPALDQDILNLIQKFQELTYDALHNRNDFYRAFLLAVFSKPIYTFLYDKISQTTEQRAATEIFRKQNADLDEIIANPKNRIQDELVSIFDYIHRCYKENLQLSETIDVRLQALPHDICKQYEANTQKLSSCTVDTEFSYKHIIDPVELQRVEEKIRGRILEIEQQRKQVDELFASLKPTFEAIALSKNEVNKYLSEMVENKQSKLDPAWRETLFIYNIFDEDFLDRYLSKHRKYFEDTKTKIGSNLGVSIQNLIDKISETEMLIKPIREKIEKNSALSFLAYQGNLQAKSQECSQGIEKLRQMLEEIDRQPQEKSQEFSRKANTSITLSLVPIFNLFAVIPLRSKTEEFLPALRSSNPHYVTLRESLVNKLKTFILIPVALAVITLVLAFLLKSSIKWILFLVTGTYAFSSLVLSLINNKLKSIR